MMLKDFWLCVLFFTMFQLLVPCRTSKPQESPYLRIMLIGDSVDRYAIDDWCAESGLITFSERTMEPTNFTSPQTFHAVFKEFGMRRKSWEVRVCENYNRKIAIGFLFNKFGCKPIGPWHCPIATMAGAEHITSQNNTMQQLWHLAQHPALRPLMRAMGGPPHGVSLTSTFWDLSHPDPTEIRKRQPNRWMSQWRTNVTILMDIIRREFKHAHWFGWRNGNTFHTTVEGFHWNTKHALNLLLEMNKEMKTLAGDLGYDYIDYHTISRFNLRDNMHPSKVPNIQFIEEVIKRTNISVILQGNALDKRTQNNHSHNRNSSSSTIT